MTKSSVSTTTSTSAAAHTFQHFQDSVSDAWDIDEPLTPTVRKSDKVGTGPGITAKERNTGCVSRRSCADELTPTHSQVSSAAPQLDSNPAGRTTTALLSSTSSPLTTTLQQPPHRGGPATAGLANSTTAVPATTAVDGAGSGGGGVQSPDADKERSRRLKFEKTLSASPVRMAELEELSWAGVPQIHRTRVWKLLCGYLAAGKSDQALHRKREEYIGYVNKYFNNKEEDIHRDTFRQISIDVPRMSPLVSLFQQKCVQEMVERILYIWAIRHPASGYVQGINDLITPFLMVFLQDFVEQDVTRHHFQFDQLDETVRKEIEADAFWCMTKVLEGIQDNYTFAQPGIQVKIRQLEELVKRVDVALHTHIVQHDVQYLQFSFRWMNNLLLRELPLNATIRLWDTYLAEREGFSKFHLYVCAAFLIRWKQELMQKKDFQGILLFIQNVPTAKWNDKDISLLVAEAYRLKYTFADAPNHLPDCRIKTTL